MTGSEETPGSSSGLPERITNELEESNDQQLRAIIHHAQELLHQRHDPTTELEPRDGEEILQIHDHDAYTIAIVKRTDTTGPDQGPFAYRVKYEPDIDGNQGQFHWHYLGRVEE